MKAISRILFAVLIVAFSVGGLYAGKDESPGKFVVPDDYNLQTTCPVMGGEIDSTIYSDMYGQRVYFCCAACIDQFNADPEKYFKKAAAEKVLFHNVQELCPVSGHPVSKEHFRYYKGMGLFFCSSGCAEKFDAAPEEILKKMKNGIKKAEKKHEHSHDGESHDHKH
ncbi:MAG: YHS domain-containing protein [Candidatus Krumholzibacteria bacterium]|nr:YHS domain-containing protein [Candidatus Krumholzibacteria bacterium]